MFEMSTRLFDFMQIAKMVLIPEISQLCSGGLIIPPKAAPNHHTALSYLTKRSHVLYVTFKICIFAHLDCAYHRHGI